MRIGIDARELSERPTGVGRYLEGLLEEWTRPGHLRHELLLYTPELLGSRAARPAWLGRPGVAERLVRGGRGTAWEQIRLARALWRDRNGLDVFFAPAYTAPLAIGLPLVVTVHDVSFAAHPEWFRRREGLRRRWLTRLSARLARIVVTVSDFSRDEIVRHLGIPAARIAVIRSGARLVPAAAPEAGKKPDGPLVLYAGAIFNRRHVPVLLRAFARLLAGVPDARLAVVGENRTSPRQDLQGLASQLGIAPRVVFTDYVGDGRLAGLYRDAKVFAFLSEYEGFGLTPLEALAAGVPIVVADTPIAREVYGHAASYVPVGNDTATAAALEELLTDETARAARLAAVPGVLARHDWSRAAEETLAALEAAAGGAAR